MYDLFVKDYLDESNPLSEISQFRLYILNEMQRRFNYMYNLDREDSVQDDYIKIANVTFAFDNSEIIKRLRRRGKAIRK